MQNAPLIHSVARPSSDDVCCKLPAPSRLQRQLRPQTARPPSHNHHLTHQTTPSLFSIDIAQVSLQATSITHSETLCHCRLSEVECYANKFRYSRDLWQPVSGAIVIICLCGIALVAEAREHHPSSHLSSVYPCEDVSHYYANVDGHSKGEALKRKLHSIISNHKSLSYDKVWDALKILDAAQVNNPEASTDIVEIYSLKVVPKALAGKPQGWNREHLWPRSYGLTTHPSMTDLHNIRPADVNVNSSRGNKFYDECRSKMLKCLKPANKEAAPDTETDKRSWTPPMQVRGDVARAVMYMAVSYGYDQPDLRLSDSPNIGNREMGVLSTLLRWNRMDPPLPEEKLRNERVCKLYQHNRNPFIDHPEYADFIWRGGFKSFKD